MPKATLDLYTTQNLHIRVDHQKNFSVNFSGFNNLDTAYSLVLTSSEPHKVEFTSGVDLVISTVDNRVTIVFDGAKFNKGIYSGFFESVSKNADVFYRNEITLELI